MVNRAIVPERLRCLVDVRTNDGLQLIRISSGNLRSLFHGIRHLLHRIDRQHDRIPSVREPRSAVESSGTESRQVNRRMRLLYRLGLNNRAGKRKKLTMKLSGIGCPDRLEHADELVRQLSQTFHRTPGGVEFVLAPAPIQVRHAACHPRARRASSGAALAVPGYSKACRARSYPARSGVCWRPP